MATVSVFVGQCGNQLGFKLDKTLFHNHSGPQQQQTVDAGNHHHHRFSHSSPLPTSSGASDHGGYRRCVMVDTETKVVNKLKKVQKKVTNGRGRSHVVLSRSVREGNVIHGKRGRGNNWALGYEGIASEEILARSIESIRKEAERCDMFSNVLMVHSLCGGTGGGLGSRLLEVLRGEFRLQHIISCVVAPFSSGDTPLQHYNALLSLTSLQKFSDAVLLFKNDMVNQHCGRQGMQRPTVSYDEMNGYIANCLAGIMVPTDTLTPVRDFGCELELSELVRSVCPQPSLKFLTTNHKSSSTSDMKGLCNSVVNLTKQENMGQKGHSLSNVAVIRGAEVEINAHVILPSMEQRIKKELYSVKWNPFPVDYWLAKEALSNGKGGNHNVTLVSNYSNIIPYASHVWSRAMSMYQQKAYLHWYNKHGLCQDYFEEAFTTVQDIVSNYTSAIS